MQNYTFPLLKTEKTAEKFTAQMTIYFGQELDEGGFLADPISRKNYRLAGFKQLLFLLEDLLGLTGHANDIDYLRVEQYRQVLMHFLEVAPDVFYTQSFEADQFATAGEMLRRRDELSLAGFDFSEVENAPERIEILVALEQLIRDESQPELILTKGFSCRLNDVISALKKQTIPIEKICLNEPFDLLPPKSKRLLNALKNHATIESYSTDNQPVTNNSSDLENFKNSFFEKNDPELTSTKHVLKNDGSLLILKSKRANEAASWTAKFCGLNPSFQPLCLLPEKNRGLDNALIQEGLPSLGILSASLARPSLQILKLITAFLWEPIDPYKILEFVSLAVKPLDNQLAQVIGRLMAATPGLKSESWNRQIAGYFADLLKKSEENPEINYDSTRREYEFWFERQRYNVNETVPKFRVEEIFEKLENWAREIFEAESGKNTSLLTLSEQARRIKELLAALPETNLTFLELERIVRTIYEPSPVQFKPEELNRLPYIYYPSAVLDEPNEFLWWNFSETESVRFFSRWYPSERDFLAQKNVQLETPSGENARMLWQRIRPVLKTKKRLIFMLSETVDGNNVNPHPMYGDLEATFKNLKDVTLNLDNKSTFSNWSKHFQLPDYQPITTERFGKPQPFVNIRKRDSLKDFGVQTPTKFQTLLYYPYQWIFKEKIKLRKSSILSVVKENTLYGNLAHRLFEQLLKENFYDWSKELVEDWIGRKLPILIQKEGAVLLMYGREPDKVNFEFIVKYAAWNLISMIQKNGWKVKATEMQLSGTAHGQEIKGIADIVLEKDDKSAIIDLKWRGIGWRRNLIRNEEDIQLVLYGEMLRNSGKSAGTKFPETSFFIIENGEMLSRQNNAFGEITPISPDSSTQEVNQRVLGKMMKTYDWRKGQIEAGIIEIRCSQTALALEDEYNQQEIELFDMLEMKDEDAKFDDYRTLINLLD